MGVGEELPYDDKALMSSSVSTFLSTSPTCREYWAKCLGVGPGRYFSLRHHQPKSAIEFSTVAEDILGLLPQGTHDPRMFIKPGEFKDELSSAGLVPGKTKGLSPIEVNRKGDFVFSLLPLRLIIDMGIARKPDTK